ncbi:hypothetical protein P7C70_g14, partial [Phenoliferia sp. Uapishka_3]
MQSVNSQLQSTLPLFVKMASQKPSRAPADAKADPYTLADEGASLKMGFEALLSSAVQESRAHLHLAEELQKSIATPFEHWSEAHKGRIKSSRAIIENHLSAYEKKQAEVTKLKALYDQACRNADSAEDELAFVKGSNPPSPADSARNSDSPRVSSPSPISSPFNGLKSPPPPPPTPAKKLSKINDEDSEDGLEPIDDDDQIIDRSGATGGSITAALGRAFTTRRKQFSGASVASSVSAASTDPKVEAAIDWSKSTFNTLFERVAGPQTGEGRSDKARKDAEATEEKYKGAVETLDQLRLTLEESLSEHFSYTHRCEQDRLKAATSVLRSFHATVSTLPARLVGSSEKVSSALQLIRPDKDVNAIVERLRTGPFQPRPTVYHSHYSEPAIHNFGIDLRKFDETNTSTISRVPSILTFLLDHITKQYENVPDAEKRKAWLYETPLSAQHHLRIALNNPNTLDFVLVEKFDLPVVAAVTKLWLLELDVPVIIYSHYDEYRSLYPKRVGAEIIQVPAKAIGDHIARLPPVHLEVLRVLIDHFVKLIASTTTEESDDVFLQKLSLSFARCLLRPKVETSLTLDDRFPSLLFVDLIKEHEVVFKSADELKTKQREDRFVTFHINLEAHSFRAHRLSFFFVNSYKPRRQRTKPVDVRMSRTRIGVDANGSVDLDKGKKQLHHQRRSLASPPPVPPLPLIDPTVTRPVSATMSASPISADSPFQRQQTETPFEPPTTETPFEPPTEKAAVKEPEDVFVEASEVIAPGVPPVAPTASPPAPEAEVEAPAPVDATPAPSSEDVAITSPTLGHSRKEGSITRREGVSGVRRAARGPRPLPGASASAASPQMGRDGSLEE